MRYLFLYLLFLCISCASTSSVKLISNSESDKEAAREKPDFLYIDVSPGQLKFVEFNSKELGILKCDNEAYRFYQDGSKVSFFWAESYFSDKTQHICQWQKSSDSSPMKIINVTVVPMEYPSEVLKVDGKRVVLSKSDQARSERESRELDMIYKQSDLKPLFKKGFKRPLNSKITSHYGKKRVFNGVRKTQHLGVDLRGAIGVPVPSSNDGVVVYAGSLFYSGGSVVIDHGLGVFTMYGHLSKVLVKVNQKVTQDQIIGLVGSTGRVTGPHLHWGAKIHGHWVDAMTLVDETTHIKMEHHELY